MFKVIMSKINIIKVISLFVGGAIVVFGVLWAVLFGISVSVNNNEIRLANQVQTTKANVDKEQQRRVRLFNNLVSAVKSYNTHEADTLKEVTTKRAGDIDKQKLTLSAVVEKYPDLKSQANYQQTMAEFSSTENRLAGYIGAYNDTVMDYNNFTQTWPNSMFLRNKSIHKFEQTKYTVPSGEESNDIFK